MAADLEQIRAYLEYFRDLGVYELYRSGEAAPEGEFARLLAAQQGAADRRPAVPLVRAPAAPHSEVRGRPAIAADASGAVRAVMSPRPEPTVVAPATKTAEQQALEAPIGKLISFDELRPPPMTTFKAKEKPAALDAVRKVIGDCTRCPLAYAGRHTIVFGNGDPSAQLMFVGEGPGADEDANGLPFVGKAGQLLNNMIGAMGLAREQVYVANIVKCRPPGNRAPEPVEANTCTQFLVEQMDIVRPKVVVALGSTAATYLMGVRQTLGSLRGRWHTVRGAKLAVTYHPAFLLRDPRQKGEAWKDLQMVMAELGLKAPAAKS